MNIMKEGSKGDVDQILQGYGYARATVWSGLVRTMTGELKVLADNVKVPSGSTRAFKSTICVSMGIQATLVVEELLVPKRT